jgi:hypothetical protein
VAKSIFLLSDIMATTDFLLKQSTTNNRHVHTHTNPAQSPLDYIASTKNQTPFSIGKLGILIKKNTLNTHYFF